MSLLTSRKKLHDVERLLCRLLSHAATARFGDNFETRGEARSCHVIPAVLARVCNGQPVAGEAVTGLITDMSTHGLAAYLPKAWHAEQVFVGVWFDGHPQVLLGELKSTFAVGGGYYRIGVEFSEVAPPSRTAAMQALYMLTAELKRPEPAAP